MAQQESKLGGLYSWSAQVAGHRLVTAPPAWSMCWAYITEDGTEVDHFDPGEPVVLEERHEEAVWREMARQAGNLSDVDAQQVRRTRILDRDVTYTSRLVQPNADVISTARMNVQRDTWVTVASWTRRLTVADVVDRSLELVIGSSQSRAQPAMEVDLASTGAHVAAAVTSRPPGNEGLAGLLLAGATRARVDVPNSTDELIEVDDLDDLDDFDDLDDL